MERRETALMEGVESFRREVRARHSHSDRANLGQFFTATPVARLMAKWSQPGAGAIRVLDPGAGVGSLTAAWIEEVLGRDSRPPSIFLTAVELDERLLPELRQTLDACGAACRAANISFRSEVIAGDFVPTAIEMLGDGLLIDSTRSRFDCVVMNPPYAKINSDSVTRRWLSRVGIETSNLYTAFLWLSVRLLAPQGELIAITPRSFCNGPYFRPFRAAFLREMAFDRIHVFESRSAAFQEDDVLQENVIFRAVKSDRKARKVVISTSQGRHDLNLVETEMSPADVVVPGDADQVIRIVSDPHGRRIAHRLCSLGATLDDLQVEVSTGRVVDFRVRESLVKNRADHEGKAEFAPLFYPTHLENGGIVWPKCGKKPNYLKVSNSTRALLVPRGNYVLVKRFSAKEERRRLTAAVCRSNDFCADSAGFENHLNFIHRKGKGLPVRLAAGLAAYLNSTLVDTYFRQFSGHTQVNATDLRSLPYPPSAALEEIGEHVGRNVADLEQIDLLLDQVLSIPRDPAEQINGQQANRRGARNPQGAGASTSATK
jgi:adenine-specific DNA-methyltransferase